MSGLPGQAPVIPTFVYMTAANLPRGHLGARAQASGLTAALVRNHVVVLTLAYVLVLAAVTQRFWDYWSTLVG